MQFTVTPALTLAALASFFSLTSSAPTAAAAPSPIIPESGVSFTPRDAANPLLAARGINDCGDSTFENQSSGGSPTVNDCWQLYNNIAGDGTWTVWLANPHTLATYGTCAFLVTPGGWPVNIGNQDIRDLIRDSIAKFQWNGLVGAKGKMRCQNGLGGDVDVTWAIYHA